MRLHGSIGSVVLAALAAPAFGQNQDPPPAQPAPPAKAPPAQEPQPPAPQGEAEPAWSFGFSAYTYFVPDDRDYLVPTFTADRDWLHLEARYNYEAVDTGSLWVGYNFAFGEEFTVELTPMIGAVFGDTQGYAPGYKATLGWKMIEFYSEGEYLFDTDDHSESFFYNWSELTVSPTENFRFGLVTQRTHLYDSDRDIQRGPLIGFTTQRLDFTGYVLDIDTDDPTYVFSIGLAF